MDRGFRSLGLEEFCDLMDCDSRARAAGYYRLVDSDVDPCDGGLLDGVADCLKFFALSAESRTFVRECINRREPATISMHLDGRGTSPSSAMLMCLHTRELRKAIEPGTLSIRIHAADFKALLDGEIDIWELSGSHISVGHPVDMPNLVIPFLYAFYGEQVNQDLASRFTRFRLARTCDAA
jgi:hypothetical protein